MDKTCSSIYTQNNSNLFILNKFYHFIQYVKQVLELPQQELPQQ